MKKIIILFFIMAILSSGCLQDIHANGGYTDVVINKKFIDIGEGWFGTSSHYILATDKGLFEIDRPILDIFNQSRNPDMVYSKIAEGKKYRLRHYGYRIDWLYEYPIAVEATEKSQMN